MARKPRARVTNEAGEERVVDPDLPGAEGMTPIDPGSPDDTGVPDDDDVDEADRPTKTVPIPPDQVVENPEGLIAENGEIIKATTQEVYDDNPEAGDADGNPPVNDPNVFENTATAARENYDPERREEIREAQRRAGDAEMREPRAEIRDKDPADITRTSATPKTGGRYARGGEDSDELQKLPNTPLNDPDAPATSFDPEVRVNQQVDLQTANRMAIKTTKEMNKNVNEVMDATTARMLRRRGRSLI